jgi:hypothetical protein
MLKIHEEITSILKSHNIDYRQNPKIASDFNDLISKYCSMDADKMNIEKAKLFTRDRMKKGGDCPLCEQNVQMYSYALNGETIFRLIKLFKHSKNFPSGRFFHVQQEIGITLNIGGGWAKLKWWGLIEQEEKEKDNTISRTSGYWRITQKGEDFINGKIRIPKYVRLYNNNQFGFKGEEVTAQDCLGQKFNFVELMNTPI